MAAKVVRFGIMGCDLMGRELASAAAGWLHLTDAKARPEIVGVCDTNAWLMEWFTTHLPSVRQTTTNYRALLANTDVDAVYCAVPYVLHAEIYPQILTAGKHLFGEKHFGMDAAQNTVIDPSNTAHPKLLVRCSSEMPFCPGARRVVDFVRKGNVGDVLEVEATFLLAGPEERALQRFANDCSFAKRRLRRGQVQAWASTRHMQ